MKKKKELGNQKPVQTSVGICNAKYWHISSIQGIAKVSWQWQSCILFFLQFKWLWKAIQLFRRGHFFGHNSTLNHVISKLLISLNMFLFILRDGNKSTSLMPFIYNHKTFISINSTLLILSYKTCLILRKPSYWMWCSVAYSNVCTWNGIYVHYYVKTIIILVVN